MELHPFKYLCIVYIIHEWSKVNESTPHFTSFPFHFKSFNIFNVGDLYSLEAIVYIGVYLINFD